MDSLDILAREEEFRKLNKQLNKKTESLMKEIEQAMQKPDIFNDFSHSLILNSNHKIKKHNYHSPSNTALSINPTNDRTKCINNTQTNKRCKRVYLDAKSSINEASEDYVNKNKRHDVKQCSEYISNGNAIQKIMYKTKDYGYEDGNIKNDSDNETIDNKVKKTKAVRDYTKDAVEKIENAPKGDSIEHNIYDNDREKDVVGDFSKDIEDAVENDKSGSNNPTGHTDGYNIKNVRADIVSDDADANEDDLIRRSSHGNCACDCFNRNSKRDDGAEFLHAFVSLNVKDNILPKSFLRGNVTVESVCKSLSSRIKLLQEQIDGLQRSISKKSGQCESHLTKLAELESERMSLLNKTNNMTSSVAEMRAKSMALQKRLEEKDRLYKEQRSNADKLASEVKRLKSKTVSVEAKCVSQEETIDTLKQQLEVARRAEKEWKESSRIASASHENAISRLESQIKALTKRTEKQMALINNLRKQNAVLATEGAVKALEIEYSEFLNQDFE